MCTFFRIGNKRKTADSIVEDIRQLNTELRKAVSIAKTEATVMGNRKTHIEVLLLAFYVLAYS